MLADCHNVMKSIQPQWRLLRRHGLYLFCPMLALLLAVLHGSVCGGLLIHSLYGGVLLAGLPTWDRQFLKRLAAGSSFLIILAEVLAQCWAAPDTLALANASIGLLVVWGAVHLSMHAITAHENQLRQADEMRATGGCNCDWRGRMLTMCAWSKQLKDGGQWVPVEEFFDRHFRIRISHGICEQIRDGLIGHSGSSTGSSTDGLSAA